MAAESISSEDEMDENYLLQQYFAEQGYWLKTTSLSEVPNTLKYEIAILFYLSSINPKEMDWMEFAYDLGLDTIVINGIECKSSKTGVPPLYNVFRLLHQKSFGEVMELFSKKRKFHILKHVKPFVEDLVLRKRNSVQPSAPLLSQELHRIKSDPGGSKESALLQKSCMKNSNVKENIENALPSFITVFIQHALSEEEPAQKLANALRKNKMMVILSKDVFPFLRINHAQILKKLNERVDFIIPIISDELLKQLGSRKTKVQCGGDLETSSNRYLYDLASHEYFNTNKNYRVRPVIDRSKVKCFTISDPLLSSPFQLWSEVPLLIENLKVIKKLL